MLLFGMDEAELRSRSHTPKKYYGIQHFFASVEDGEAVVLLNCLRAEAREVELVAYEAFKTEDGEPKRPDIIRALNRLSSAYYIMMFKAKTKEYDA
jgi:ethanolamine utilization cobalamin adenosyltransferase